MSFPDFLLARRRDKRAAGQWISTGLGDNLDLEIAWDSQAVARLAEASGAQVGELPAAPPASIGCARDLVEALLSCFHSGEGGDLPLSDPMLLSSILSCFRYSRSIGGTGARAACALGRLDFPTLVHLDVVSSSILEELGSFGLRTVRGGTLLPVDPHLGAVGEDDAPHCVFQFREGDVLELAGARITCPRSNRLILTADRINQELPIDPAFLSYLLRQDVRVSSFVLSGFNSVVEPLVLASRLDLLAEFLPALRRKGVVVYLEDAAYHVPALKTMVLSRLGPLVDVFGFNEQELRASLGGQEVDVLAPRELEMALEELRARFRIPAALLHTQDYALACGRLPERDIESGLLAGHCLAAARALHSRYGGWREVEQACSLPESPAGAVVCRQLEAARSPSALRFAPARKIERPRSSLGLGDAFVGGFQLCL
jgi:ADP-dependent phosphofructokinase/glucokinase